MYFILICFINFLGLRISDWGTAPRILSTLNFKLSFHGSRTPWPNPIPIPWTNSYCIWYGILHNYPEAKVKFSRSSLHFLMTGVCRNQLGRETCTDINRVVTKTGHNIQSTRPEQYRYWTNGCVNSCVNSPEDGPVGPKHVEIRQYINKIEIVTSVGFYSIRTLEVTY